MITTAPPSIPDVKARLVLLRVASRLSEEGGDARRLIQGASHASLSGPGRTEAYAQYLASRRRVTAARSEMSAAEDELTNVTARLIFGEDRGDVPADTLAVLRPAS